MFAITTILSNNSSNLELEILLEPQNKMDSKCKTAITDLKRRLSATVGRLLRQGYKSSDVKGLIFRDFTSIKPVNIPADKVLDYPEKIFSIINDDKFQLKYVVLQGAISSADIELFLKLIMAELKNNKTIETIVLRNIADINSLARLKNINFRKRIKLCIEYNEETALNQAKNILSKKENIEYILLSKLNLVESNQRTISTHNNPNEKSSNPNNQLSDSAGVEVFAKVLKSLKSDEKDEINSNFSNHNNKSYYVSSDSVDGNCTDDEKGNQSRKVEAQEFITKDTTAAITQHAANQTSKVIENNVNQPKRPNVTLTSPEIRMNIIKKHLSELEPEIENLRTQIKDVREKNSKLEQQNEEFKLQDKALKEENQRLKQTEVYAALVSPNSNASLDKKLFDQLITQAASADTWHQENKILWMENVSLKAENNELQVNNKFLQDENATLNSKVDFLQNQNNKLRENIETLRTGNTSMVDIINSLKAKEKELDVAQSENRTLKAQIGILNEKLRREREKNISSNNLSNNNNYPVRNTSPQPSQSVNSSAPVGYNNAATNTASQPGISNHAVQKKRSLEELDPDSLRQPPSLKAQKLTSTSSPGNNHSQRSPFWNDPSSSSVDHGVYPTITHQPAEYSPNVEQRVYAPAALQPPHLTQQQSVRDSSKAVQKKYVEIAPRPPHLNQQTLVYPSEADQQASAHTAQGYYYTPDFDDRGHYAIENLLPWSSVQAIYNNNTSDNDTSSRVNFAFNKPK